MKRIYLRQVFKSGYNVYCTTSINKNKNTQNRIYVNSNDVMNRFR